MHHNNSISTTTTTRMTHILKHFNTLFLQFRLRNYTALSESETAKESDTKKF